MYKIYSVDYKQTEEDLVELSIFERIAKLGEKFTLKLKTTVSLTSLIESKVSVIKQAEQTLNLPNRLLMVKEAIREYTQKQLEELFVEDETVTETKWYNGQVLIEDPQQITAKLSKRLEIVRELSDKVKQSPGKE